MDSAIRPHSIRHRRRAQAQRLRVAWLAVLLILTNALAPWTAALAGGHAAHVPASSHHCHDGTGAKSPRHGGACPCCDGGCQCLYTSAAPLPAFLALRAPAPFASVATRDRYTLPAPPATEHLRPPIA